MHGDVCKSVYCHYDGYLQYTGRLLQANYDSTLANQMVARGDNSGVKETLEGMNFYGDPSQDDVGYHIARTFEEFLEQVDNSDGEWYYVMQNDVWYVGNMYHNDQRFYKQLVPLAAAVAELEDAAAA
jgi:hypothetical protein